MERTTKLSLKIPSNNEDVEDTIDLSLIEPKEFDFDNLKSRKKFI